MTEEAIPEDIRKFILTAVDSIAQWEGLLLLRADPTQRWSADTVAQRLYVSKTEATWLLDQLVAKGFLATQTDNSTLHYFYHPSLPETDQMIERVADFYARCLVPVTHLIHSKSKSRIQEFADAFWLRKRINHGRHHL